MVEAMAFTRSPLLLGLLLFALMPMDYDFTSSSAIVTEEFIFVEAPFAECHASSISQSESSLLVAWFGGTEEGHPDVGIWLSRNEGGGWSKPVEVANGVQDDKKRYPCWNPVLFQVQSGPLLLFYKVGPNPREWWGMLTTSEDGGKTWLLPRRLPESVLGPIKNKPVELPDGSLLCPSSTEHDGWRVHMEITADEGKTWHSVGPINEGGEFDAIQPTILGHTEGRFQILCRSKQGRIAESWSSDSGLTWTKMVSTTLPNPNSGIDAVTLSDGRHLLVYNHTAKGRSPLNVAISNDGKTWKMALVLERQKGEYSYPAVIQTRDGLVHITYTYQRKKIKHVVIDASGIDSGQIRN